MNTLFWKDVRANRALLILTGVLSLGLLALTIARDHSESYFVARNLTVEIALALIVLQLPLAFLVGNLFAGERVDRSAEFLGSLPVPRCRILTSKLFLVLGTLGLIWLPNLAVLAGAVRYLSLDDPVARSFLPFVRTTFFVGLLIAAGAWFFSARMSSPVFAASLGILAPLVVLVGSQLLLRLCGIAWDWQQLAWYHGLCLVIAVILFAAGAQYYLRRVEP